ncbi:MAG: MerR family transcriptional regulator [Thiohalomonadaceae bacterium]
MARYKIGDAAKRLGISVRTLRFYEEEGLITPIRTSGGTRLYTEAHLEQLQAVLTLASHHFPLESVRALIAARETGGNGAEGSAAVCAVFDDIAIELQQRIETTQRFIGELMNARKVVRQCRRCTNPPTNEGCPGCPVKRHLHETGLLRLVWDQSTTE